ncbi:glyceraldehyde-3-phosphate dehydrogenase 1 [Chytriomyces hyalinus]|nr:glyceraldehyde-3-phosphate dehydrogenase 1 [Chytriomyces hyalinus]
MTSSVDPIKDNHSKRAPLPLEPNSNATRIRAPTVETIQKVAELRAAVQEASNRVIHMECSLSSVEVVDSVETTLDTDLKEAYAKLVSLLRSEPMHLASLAHAISLNEMNASLESTIFSIYGNQFNTREEHLLLSLLQNIVSIQFDKATNFGSVMRANTPASRMLSSYTRRRVGTQYLRHTISLLMAHVTALGDTCLEINPFKLDSRLQTSFSSSRDDSELAHSDSFFKPPIRNVFSSLPRRSSTPALRSMADIIDDRVQLLAELVGRFLETVIESIDFVPHEIKWLCKQIWMIAKAKFPQESESNIASLIGGFFLLRYINPAIVSPEVVLKPSEVDPKVLSPNGKRTLTLVAKALQMIANKPSTVKETYMAPLIPLIQEHKIRLVYFFKQLCDAQDFLTLANGESKYEENCSVEHCFAVFKSSDAALQIRVEELQRLSGLLERHLGRLDPASVADIQPILHTISLHNPSQLNSFLQRSIITLQLSPPALSSAVLSTVLNNFNPDHQSLGDAKTNLFRHLQLALLRNQSDSDSFDLQMHDLKTSSFTTLSALVDRAMESSPNDSHLFKLGKEARLLLEETSSEAMSDSFDLDAIIESLRSDMKRLTQRCSEIDDEVSALEAELQTLLQMEKILHERFHERDRRTQHRSSFRIKSIWSYFVGK